MLPLHTTVEQGLSIFRDHGLYVSGKSSPSGDDLNAVIVMATPNTVGGEIAAVYGEDCGGSQHFCGHNEGRIGKVHGMVCVLRHQLKSTLKLCATHKPDRQAVAYDELA